jgi:hypothetical protein
MEKHEVVIVGVCSCRINMQKREKSMWVRWLKK